MSEACNNFCKNRVHLLFEYSPPYFALFMHDFLVSVGQLKDLFVCVLSHILSLMFSFLNIISNLFFAKAQFESHESELKELGTNIEALKRNYCELLELQYVLRHTDNFLLEVRTLCLKDEYIMYK